MADTVTGTVISTVQCCYTFTITTADSQPVGNAIVCHSKKQRAQFHQWVIPHRHINVDNIHINSVQSP